MLKTNHRKPSEKSILKRCYWEQKSGIHLDSCEQAHPALMLAQFQMPTPIKVAIVEDETSFRESIAVLINGAQGFRCVGTYPNAETALKELLAKQPDVVLMDINLPKLSGIDCVARLKSMMPALLVVMLTAYADTEKIFQSLEAGASGYLLKQTSPAEILQAISEVHAGGSPMSNAIARKVVQFFQRRKSLNETENLSKREHEILSYLAKGYQYKEIADQLGLSVLTVGTHIRNTYEKLHVRSRTEAIMKFLGTESKQ
jgi:DNA-binding NarL/FixJ family response regulator